MRILAAMVILVVSVVGLSPLPWPSFAYMEAQSGTLYRHQVKQKIAEYEAHGCTFIGVTRFGPKQQYANVWCVRVEEFPDE